MPSARPRTSAATSVELGLEPGQPFGERLEARVEAGQAARLAHGHRRGVAGAGAVGGQRLADRSRSPGDRLAMLGGRQPRPDLVGLAGPEASGGDLGRLVLEQVHPARQLARVDRQLGERRAVGAPALDHVGHRRARRRVPAVARRAGRAASARRAGAAGRAGRGSRRADRPRRPAATAVVGDVVEPGGRPAAGGHLADGDERLGKPVEQRLDAGRLGAVADERRVGARARGRARAHRSAGSCRRRSRR